MHVCALRSCGKAIDEAAAQVATTANIRGLTAALKAGKTAVNWKVVGRNTGDAYFHRACFDALQASLRRRRGNRSTAALETKRAKRGNDGVQANTDGPAGSVMESGLRRSSRLRRAPATTAEAKSTAALSPLSRESFDEGPQLTGRERAVFEEAMSTAEYTDSLEDIKAKAAAVASLIKDINAAHSDGGVCFFTGAGISTNAGIGDYRGRKGKWTEEDTGVTTDEDGGIDYEALRPTFTHEAIAKMVGDNTAAFVITQNCDCLHGLSGVPADKLAELHGNVFVEVCSRCRTRYMCSQYVLDDESEAVVESGKIPKGSHVEVCPTCGLNHFTGRYCSRTIQGKRCNGKLKDTIINFGDDLEEPILTAAERAAAKCKLMISLGSSMTVTPANSLVDTAPKLVVVNRQLTDYDKKAKRTARVFADTDTFMRLLMEHLLPDKELERWDEFVEKTKRRSYDAARQPDAKPIVIPQPHA
ncbi:hypothetical protein PTSG_05548 [Salpingoeca rosetta]|uniref:Regulatory protein SIR2 homolog 7 n=1 Tax=Salpingoeca rosetta (strain ATCC 50818 / BSB-021) TaxID=946362 RepID=F2UBI7_SALR5|nr:uncharacterized protein PTSG_05548 [Salpingoeca rosetta]EGD73853.1 hypothetical protein PTSG_05548 [Salpingoeca rosetta]|eukprot:XP_004993416.1 hypothetical protein PTSG_05548 [Salpingoeca rosetta]